MGHLHAYALILLRSAIWLVILAIIFIPAEHLFPLHRARVFRKQSRSISAITFSTAWCWLWFSALQSPSSPWRRTE
jgi:hypothetical protein